MFKFLLGLLLIFMFGFLIFSPKKISHEEVFWNWFVQNETNLRQIDLHTVENNEILNELSRQLKNVDKNLIWEFSTATNPRDFIISADGIRESFPSVILLVNSSPKLPNWRILAFRQRTPGVILSFRNVALDPQMVYFYSEQNKGLLDLSIYIKDIPVDENLIGAIYLLLDSLIGEYDVETKVGAVEVLPYKEKLENLKPLTELPRMIDSIPQR